MNENMNYNEGKAIIWHAYDRLRMTKIEDKSIFIYLLHLCSQKIFDDYNHHSFRNDYVYKLIENKVWYGDIENHDILRELTKVFNEELSYFDNDSQAFYDIICSLMDISSEWYDKYYTKIFDELLLLIFSNYQSKAHIQPAEITKVIAKLSGYTNKGIVYNPFAGLASFGIEMKVTKGYFAQEQNKGIWAIGVLRLLANNISPDNYECQDSVLYWKAKYLENDYNKSLFDLIVATPPFGMLIQHEEFFIERSKPCNAEDFFIARGIEGLSAKGKLIGLFSTGVLFKGGATEQERRFAVDNDYLETVVSLPANLLYNTAISTTILVFSKNKKLRGNIKFVDGTSFFEKRGRGNVLLTNKLLTSIENNDSQFVRFVSTKNIIENDYNLSVNRYFSEKIDKITIPDGFTLVKLGEIASVVRGEKNGDSIGQNVKISDLKSDPFNFEVKSSDFEIISIPSVYQKITSNVLLLSKINTLKPTYCFVFENESININNNIIALHVNEAQVDIRFLVLELYTERVKSFVNSRISGVTIQFMKTKDILEIPILLPSLKEQKEIVEESRKQLILEKEKELKQIKEKFEQQTYEEFASLKHALGKPIPGINTALEYIYNYLKNNDGSQISLNDVVSNRRQTTLQDKFDVIFNGLKLIQTMLEKGENGLILEKYPLDNCNIAQELLNFSKSYSSDKFSLHIYYEDKEVDNVEVLANADLLNVLLNDVLSNVNNHAFKESNLEKNKVDMFVTTMENKLLLLIANNGIPFPENFDQSKFIQKYQKAGSNSGAGIGGFDINRISEYFKGNFILITERNYIEGYTTIYEFDFPILDFKEENYE
jgi:type I restriction enzyme M protein